MSAVLPHHRPLSHYLVPSPWLTLTLGGSAFLLCFIIGLPAWAVDEVFSSGPQGGQYTTTPPVFTQGESSPEQYFPWRDPAVQGQGDAQYRQQLMQCKNNDYHMAKFGSSVLLTIQQVEQIKAQSKSYPFNVCDYCGSEYPGGNTMRCYPKPGFEGLIAQVSGQNTGPYQAGVEQNDSYGSNTYSGGAYSTGYGNQQTATYDNPGAGQRYQAGTSTNTVRKPNAKKTTPKPTPPKEPLYEAWTFVGPHRISFMFSPSKIRGKSNMNANLVNTTHNKAHLKGYTPPPYKLANVDISPNGVISLRALNTTEDAQQMGAWQVLPQGQVMEVRLVK